MIAPEDFPSVNAILNGAGLLFLLLGYIAICQRWITLHKGCMLTAFATFTVFLASYLYYHFAIRHGEATRFRDRAPLAPRWVEVLYLAILLSHTILAAATAPLAVTTVYLGLRNRLKKHVKIARWTLPIWLYVSVTGIVVYWMLYRLYQVP